MSYAKRFERWWINTLHARHQPAIDQILQAIREMRVELEEEMQGAIEANRRTHLHGPEPRRLDGGIGIELSQIKYYGERLEFFIWCRKGGLRVLLESELVSAPDLDAGGFSNNPRMVYFPCSIKGPELWSTYRHLPH